MAEGNRKSRRRSLELVPGHKYDETNYLKVDLNTSYRKKSSSRAEDAIKTGLDNLYENPTVVPPLGNLKPVVIRQSPIDIQLRQTYFDPYLESHPLKISYPTKIEEFARLRNTGNTWKLRVGDDRFGLSGGPLKHRYRLDQLHAHWGPNNIIGSEHTVNRYSYAGELHFVHWNTGKCKAIDTAASQPDGLAVIGVFLKLGASNPEMEKLTDAMQDIHYCGQEVSVDDAEVDLRKLMPNDTSQYWTYDGSLTTTPYDDCVIWIVMKNPIEVSHKQLEAMRSLLEYEQGQNLSKQGGHCGRVMHNFREVQDQSRVKVRSSFRVDFDYI